MATAPDPLVHLKYARHRVTTASLAPPACVCVYAYTHDCLCIYGRASPNPPSRLLACFHMLQQATKSTCKLVCGDVIAQPHPFENQAEHVFFLDVVTRHSEAAGALHAHDCAAGPMMS